ncbi:hypothetical protein OIE80_34750 (plasmid) [Streptomyces cellulosae]|uniref:hypothetical protein n=1 Tax=Streptomyces cellulosae TaxID=1968 RepID=UPI002F90A1DC|nr:hypothetical protein OG837_35980 [Streptomyces cellulosae]
MSRRLAAAIEREDRLEDAGMPADDRVTCSVHQAWAADCADRHGPLTACRVLVEALEIDRIRARSGSAGS